MGLDPFVGPPPLTIADGRTTVESGGVRLLGNIPPAPTTTGVTVKLLVVQEGTTIPARKEAGDPPPETGVTVTPDDVVIIPVTDAVAVTVTAVVVPTEDDPPVV